MKKALKTIALLAAVCIAVFALRTMGAQVAGVLAKINIPLALLAVAGLTIYQFLNAGTWSAVFAGLGKKVPFGATARVWIESESMKWLPGGIWGYGSRVINARKLGIELPIASAALATELSITVFVWFLTALWILPTTIGHDITNSALAWIAASGVLPWIGGCVAVLSTMLIPRVRAAFGSILKRFVPQSKDVKWQPRSLFYAFFSYALLCLANGTLLWLVTLSIPGLSLPWATAIGVGGVAWLAGFFAIGVPGGIGVREAALAGLLAWHGTMEASIAAAVVFRATQVMAELIALGASLFMSWRISCNHQLPHDSAISD